MSLIVAVVNSIERAVMSADPEEDVLLSEFEQILNTPLTNDRIEALFTTSTILKSHRVEFISQGNRSWQLIVPDKSYVVTFHPEVFEERASSIRLLAFGDPLFDRLLTLATVKSDST